MSDRGAGRAPSRVIAVLGPTNTGKTHFAVERMLGHASGMVGLPLRLLAREVYDRIVKSRGKAAVALITGEEKIVPPRPHYFICTVEAMPLQADVEFLAIDEIQLCADPDRGHVFTQRLLHARGKVETLFMGAGTMRPLIERLLPEAEFVTRERFSNLTYAGSKKLTKLPRRSAIVAFSAEQVYAIAELIRRQRGGAAVVMGSLSPRTRNAQVALYQSGEVDFLVATDAIGMGLNMDVDHVAFAGLRKFDGRRMRWLHAQEIGQIGGRAGRYQRDGTFGVTGEAPEIDEDVVEAVEAHAYEPVREAEWRNPRLDFDSLPDLLRSLSRPPDRAGLKLAAEALDEKTLRACASDEDVVRRARDRARLQRLWDACQLPDFRKVSPDEHVRLVLDVFRALTGPGGRLSEDWIAPQLRGLDRLDGDIEALAGRLANVRTLAYVANRPDWLHQLHHWQGKTREVEDRLSDTLHERLMQRFIDRRTSVLMRALRVDDEVQARVGDAGEVTVEGAFLGRLRGLRFEPARGESLLEDKALREAARRAVSPVIARRLGELAAAPDEAFGLLPDGTLTWKGEAAGRVNGGPLFAPRVRLFGELGPEPARTRAVRRLEAWVAAEAGRRLHGLKRLEAAMGDGSLRGVARGIAWRLVEAGGVLDRASARADLEALSPAERRALRSLGVRIGAFSVWLPSVLTEPAKAVARALAEDEAKGWAAPSDRLSLLPPTAPPRVLSARGLRAVGRWAVPVDALERLDEALRAGFKGSGSVLSDEARGALGWTEGEARDLLRALGYAPVRKSAPGEPVVWRRRHPRPATAEPPARPDSPFAALAALTAQPAPARRKRPRRRRPVAAKKC
jgi:ATP-dependent RNA helicase SUPV3L1/SUV3